MTIIYVRQSHWKATLGSCYCSFCYNIVTWP